MDVKRAATRDDGAGTVRDRLRAALPEAMKARDAVAVAALRSALGALDNAEAVDADLAPQSSVGHPRLARTVSGLRAAEVERRSLSAAEMEELVRAEVAERHTVACDYERAGHRAHAEQLRSEATVLTSCLGGGDAPRHDDAGRDGSRRRSAAPTAQQVGDRRLKIRGSRDNLDV